jgi:hypothetical protein
LKRIYDAKRTKKEEKKLENELNEKKTIATGID